MAEGLTFEGCALVATLVLFWLVGRLRTEHRILVRTATRLTLPVDEATAPAIMARLSRRERAGLAGAALLAMIVLPIWHHWLYEPVLAHPQPVSPLILITPALTVVAGRLVALTGLTVWDASRRRRASDVRIARAFVPTLTQYVRAREIWAARTTACVALPLAALSTWDDRLDGRRIHSATSVITTVAVLLLLLVLAELTSHRLVAVGQPAASAMDLVWDDGLRSMQLRELYLTVTVASLYVAVLFTGGLPSPVGATAFLSAFAVVGWCVAGSPGSYYLRRLWPATQQSSRAAA